MKQSNILQRICPGDWYAKAYSEYLQDVANTLVSFKESISSFILEATDQFDDRGLDPNNDDHIYDFIHEVIGNYTGINLDSYYPFNEGYLLGYDILKSLIKVYCVDSVVNEFDTQTTLTLRSKLNETTDIKLSVSSMLGEIAEMIHSAALSASALKASTFTNLTDKITSFKNTFSSFTQGELNFGNIDVSYFNNLLESTKDAEQFLVSWVSASNIDQIADDSDPMTYHDSLIAKYTGANPMLSADFSTVVNAGITVISAGTKVVKGIFNAVANLGKSLFNKAKKFVVDTVIDPTFVNYDKGDGLENCVDGLLYQGSINLSLMCDNGVSPDFINTQDWEEKFNDFAYNNDFYKSDAVFTNWIKIKTIFGNIMFKYKSTDDGYDWLDYKLQPLVLNPYSPLYTRFAEFITLSNARYSSVSQRDGLYSTFVNLINDCFTNFSIADLYPDESIAKEEFMYAYNLSLQFITSIIPFVLLEVITSVRTLYYDDPLKSSGHISARCNNSFSNYSTYQWNMNMGPDELPSSLCTNKQAFSFATGYSPNYEEFKSVFPAFNYNDDNGIIEVSESSRNGNVDVLVVMLFYCYMLSRLDRRKNPTNYLFLPFLSGTEDMDNGKWSIKTDSEINDAFTAFITAAIIVVVAVVVLSAAAITFKKIANARLKKQLERKSQLDSKMWNGEQLTAKEYRKYKRLSKKIDASKILNGSGGSGITLGKDSNAGSASEDIILLLNRIIMGQE